VDGSVRLGINDALYAWRCWILIRPEIHTLAGRAGGCSATGATWSLRLLRTDSVNLGFCISLLILAIVVLARLPGLFLFLTIPGYWHGLRAESGHNSSRCKRMRTMQRQERRALDVTLLPFTVAT
jgi:hypothetical protein